MLRFDGAAFVSIAMVPNGTVLGEFALDTATDRVEAVADLDGDGRAEIVISGPNGVSVLGLSGSSLAQKAFVPDAATIGQWVLDTALTGFVATGDVDGDGKQELIVTNSRGLAVLALRDGALTAPLVQWNGARLGEWNLNTRDNHFGPAMDIDGDGRDEIVVASPWGIGILRLAGDSGDALMLAPNGTRFGEWNLNTADNDWAAGHSHSWGIFVHHPDWGGAVAQTKQVLASRGYTLLDTNTASVGIEMINRIARVARSSDRVFVYLAGHGAAGRSLTSDHSTASAFWHYVEFESGGLHLNDVAPAFSLMGNKGVDLGGRGIIYDGGETVLAATGERYLAVATTGVYAPGITDTPSPGNVLQSFGQPSTYGMWWSQADPVSRMTGEAPHRFYQKMFRNDDTEIARWSLFYKTAINFYPAVAGSWDLVTRNCYIFEYVYADLMKDPNPGDEVKSFKMATKIGLTDYLAAMQADYDGFAPTVAVLRKNLADGGLVDRAAGIYAAAYPRPWQTTTGVFDWDVAAAPLRLVDNGAVWLAPSQWAGADGFRRLVAECLRRLAELEASWGTQKQRLIDLDRKVVHDRLFAKVTDINAIRMVATLTQQQRMAEFDTDTSNRMTTFMTQLRGAGSGLGLGLGEESGEIGVAMPKAAIIAIDDALKVENLDASKLTATVRTPFAKVFGALLPEQSVAEIVADIRATDTALAVSLGQLHYYLTIVEEAVSKAAETGAQPGDLTSF